MVVAGLTVLVVNAGSSSTKLRVVADGAVVAATDDGALEDFIAEAGTVDAVGHRVVHGGSRFTAPTIIDADVRAALEALAPLAPLHQPAALALIDRAGALLPEVPSVACFDTAFHATLTEAARTYAVSRAWTERWQLRRYGFHGLSHSWAAQRGVELAGVHPSGARIVTCHLGAGSSLCAVVGGRSVDTTMGFTPGEGVVMARRSGSVDPGLVLWLLQEAGLSVGEVARGLLEEGGLFGLAGTADMREVLAAAARGDIDAERALAVWGQSVLRGVGAMIASAGGVDVLVFTGGIGEHVPRLRNAVCAHLGWAGIDLDDEANDRATSDAVVSASGSAVAVTVVTAREELQIARMVTEVLG